MVDKLYEIAWSKRSQTHMKEAYSHISKDSLKNAAKVLEDIIKAVTKAKSNPEYYNLDKYKSANDGSYRAFEKHHYRISYRVMDNAIVILRVRHTSMMPKKY